MLPNLHGLSAQAAAYDVAASPSMDHRDDVEQMFGHKRGFRTSPRFSTRMRPSLQSLKGGRAWRSTSRSEKRRCSHLCSSTASRVKPSFAKGKCVV